MGDAIDWPRAYSASTEKYQLRLVLPDMHRDTPAIHWELRIGREFNTAMLTAFASAKWSPARSVWILPFSGSWTTIDAVTTDIEQCVIRPYTTPSPPTPKNTPPAIARGRHAYEWTRPAMVTPKADLFKRKETPAPAPRTETKRARREETSDVETIDMEYEPTPVPDACSAYAAHEVERLASAERERVLVVEERRFGGGVRCVSISGRVAEVEAYYEARFIVAHGGARHRVLQHNENKERDYGARIVAQFIF